MLVREIPYHYEKNIIYKVIWENFVTIFRAFLYPNMIRVFYTILRRFRYQNFGYFTPRPTPWIFLHVHFVGIRIVDTFLFFSFWQMYTYTFLIILERNVLNLVKRIEYVIIHYFLVRTYSIGRFVSITFHILYSPA